MPLFTGAGAAIDMPGGDAGDASAVPSEKARPRSEASQDDVSGRVPGAKTPELKLELGKRLLDVAGQTDNPTERYTLQRKALDLAAAGASPQLIVEAAEQLADSFAVDPLELKADALARRRRHGQQSATPPKKLLGQPSA